MNNPFERYQCQIALPSFGEEKQRLLQNAKVLIVGMGGLGCPTAQYLSSAGVGTIGIADDDIICESNLHRQILYAPEDIGLFKVDVATQKLQQQNPSIQIIPFNFRVSSKNVMNLIADFDLVLEGTDNLETKCLINDACVLSGKPLVYGAIYQYEGQVSIWNVLQKDGTYSPNYRDVFLEVENAQIPNCSQGGVIPTLAGIVGCMQANETIKYLIKSDNLLTGKLWMMNVMSGKTQIIKLRKNTSPPITELPKTISEITFEDLEKHHYQLIDVRTVQEHQNFNIGGKNIPLENLDNQMDLINPGFPIACYCATGKRSTTAAGKIKKVFTQAEVYSLKGGINNRSLNCI